MHTVFPGSHSKINGIFEISMIKCTGKDAETKTFQTFVGIGTHYCKYLYKFVHYCTTCTTV